MAGGVNPKKSPRRRRSFNCKLMQQQRRQPPSVMATPSKNANCSNIRVLLRVRPPTKRELEEARFHDVVEVVDKKLVIFDPKEEENPFFHQGKKQTYRDITKRQHKNLQFSFDQVFGPDDSTSDVYTQSIQNLIASLISGYNCSVFAYGATGSGKTHTMLGTPESPGVTPLLMRELYSALNSQENADVDVIVSYLEIYNEAVHDLLVDQAQVKPLQLRDDGASVLVTDLSWHRPATADELMEMLQLGNLRRTQHPTDANAESSRSHAVFQVVVKMKSKNLENRNQVRCAKLSMIDLAGSERAAATKNNRNRFAEGANINKSLLALGNCINALADGLKHIPFRNSKLTRLLKGSLGGNCQTVMIANTSPSSAVYEDTYNTLKYATRAKKIKNRVKKNLVSMEFNAAELTRAVEEARSEISMLRDANKKLLAENAELRAENLTLKSSHVNTADEVMSTALETESNLVSESDTSKPVAAESVEAARNELHSLQHRVRELEAELISARTDSPPTPSPSPDSSPKTTVTNMSNCETELCVARFVAKLQELTECGRCLEKRVQCYYQLQSQLECLEYTHKKKLDKIERVNELKKDSTQTKVHSLEVKTQAQRSSLMARIQEASKHVAHDKDLVSRVLLELQQETDDRLVSAVIPLFDSRLELMEVQEKLKSASMACNMHLSDLESLHSLNMSTASLLHKTFYILKALGSTSPDMEAQYEAVVTLARRTGKVTFVDQDHDKKEVDEVMAEPLHDEVMQEELGPLDATFCIPAAATSRPASLSQASLVPRAPIDTTNLRPLATEVRPTSTLPPDCKKSRLTPPMTLDAMKRTPKLSVSRTVNPAGGNLNNLNG